MHCAAVKGGGVRRVERSPELQPSRQVGIGDEELSEGDCVSLARIQRGLGCLLREALVGNEGAAEGALEAGPKARCGE